MTRRCIDTAARAAAELGFECMLAQDGCATRTLSFAGEAGGAALSCSGVASAIRPVTKDKRASSR
ncbi:MAG: isochorismatase family protein [Ideonella sp.]|nr:isochorismatase family protein [Ideonella sp.]MBP6778851.1 isochorismatase family protein [Piscinibacter sp.]